ncbi:UNVERIFIED_CONTAM: WD repeat-containing protein 44 [Sesamum latifolium]|uniref:WD repeat-containing protein 44 n=1 Tax=Sesamum latifolium TaxID=2727402 RepID=A0AAW2XDS0_9LAMI
MNRRTLTMDFDSLGVAVDEDDSFFDSNERLSTVVPLDLAAADDEEFFEASRMSFVSGGSIKRIYSIAPIANNSTVLPSYDMWMAEPGDVKERRKKLLQGMGLNSNKNFMTLASTKVVRAISIKPPAQPKLPPQPQSKSKSKSKTQPQPQPQSESAPAQDSAAKVDSSLTTADKATPARAILLVRSRSDSDIEAFSSKLKQRKEELLGPVSKNKITRTLSGQLTPTTCIAAPQYYTSAFGPSSTGEKCKPTVQNMDVSMSDAAFGSFFLIKNLDTGKDFIVKEANENGMWNKLNDLQTGEQLTLEEFEKSVGYSPFVKELMRRRASTKIRTESGRLNPNALLTKSFRSSKKKGAAILKNIKGVASGLLSDKELENPPQVEEKAPKNTSSQWVEAHQQGKPYKEFTALHLSQEIQAHEGSIWTIRFNSDGRFLASAGEDRTIHVWEMQECDLIKQGEDPSSDMAGNISSDRPPLAELTPMPSEMKRKGKTNGGKPDYVSVPETVQALSEKPVCSFTGHTDEVLDLSWSTSQLLLSSSMDKTVRMWDMEKKSCLKTFAHNDFVTCIQFNPADEDYFISGSLDAKVRIWNIPKRKVVDWTDLPEMVTAASYTPDGQGAIIGSLQGTCRLYSIEGSRLDHKMDIQTKKKSQGKKFPTFQSPAKKDPGLQAQAGKITGFQFTPWNPAEVLITATDNRLGIYNGPDLIQKFRGFRNTGSQIAATFSPDGKHVISASEDSQVYIWKVEESKNPPAGKKKSTVTVQAHEHFPCKDVSVAMAWPGSIKFEAPLVEIQSRRTTKRSSAPPTSASASPSREDNPTGGSSRQNLPPLPKKKSVLERDTSTGEDELGDSGRIDPGIGPSDSFSASSDAICYGDSPSISSASSKALGEGGSSSSGGQTVQATAWGMVIVTASLEGEIRVYQNFGLPLKVGRQGLF